MNVFEEVRVNDDVNTRRGAREKLFASVYVRFGRFTVRCATGVRVRVSFGRSTTDATRIPSPIFGNSTMLSFDCSELLCLLYTRRDEIKLTEPLLPRVFSTYDRSSRFKRFDFE